MSHLKLLRSAGKQAVAVAVFLVMPGWAQAMITLHTYEAAWRGAVAAPTLVGFDDLVDGTPVTNQYAGLEFSAINGGNPLAVAYNSSLKAGPTCCRSAHRR